MEREGLSGSATMCKNNKLGASIPRRIHEVDNVMLSLFLSFISEGSLECCYTTLSVPRSQQRDVDANVCHLQAMAGSISSIGQTKGINIFL